VRRYRRALASLLALAAGVALTASPVIAEPAAATVGRPAAVAPRPTLADHNRLTVSND
jgi:hypothetical protein